MATLVEAAESAESFRSASSLRDSGGIMASPTDFAHYFDDGRYYLLVVLGELISTEHLKCAVSDIEKGIRSWDTNLINCNLDQELKLFVSRHSARFSSDVQGQKVLHHKSSILETVVLINPSDEALSTEVRLMISDVARHKLLVLAGQSLENTGELILQSGSFSFFNFIDIFTDQEIGELLSTIHPANKAKLTVYCPKHGDWKNSNLDKHSLQDFINIHLNSVFILPEMEGLSEFTEYLSESVEILSPFDMLEPPSSGGFLKLSKPCCYIFPGGKGDSALFAVNGFNMLVNGGSDRKSCFWKLVRHLDRIDSILLTHIGDDSLPGINSMLQRKTAELEEEQSKESTANSEWMKNMISPDIGVVFLNLPPTPESFEQNHRVRRNIEEATLTLQYLSKLSLKPTPLQRNIGNTIEPIILFQKMGVGKLEMYVLNPAKNSKELQYFMKQWTGTEKDKSSVLLQNGNKSELPISYLSSISSLIVWHPSNQSEKIVRVLFPGNATQNSIFEGLDKLKHLDFLKHPVVTEKELSSNMEPPIKQAKVKQESKDSPKSLSKASPIKGIQKLSKEDVSEKVENDSGTLDSSLKTKKKEKPLAKPAKIMGKEVKMEQKSLTDSPEKQKANIKTTITPKTSKETKKVVKKIETVKKEESTEKRKGRNFTPQNDEKATIEKLKKEELRKQGKKKDIRKGSPMKESRKEEKKEIRKDEKDVKADSKKPANLKNNSHKSDVKKPIPKLKAPIQAKTPGSPAKPKEKTISKSSKKDAEKPKAVAAAPVSEKTMSIDATIDKHDIEDEISIMSSPEDLTKDFEALKAEDICEYDESLSQNKTQTSEQGAIQHEEVKALAEYLEDNLNIETNLTIEADVECVEMQLMEKTNVQKIQIEKFEDDEPGFKESSDVGHEEKGLAENEDDQEQHMYTQLEDDEIQVKDYKRESCETEYKVPEKQNIEVHSPIQLPASVSPAVSIHDETLPGESECEIVSDDDNQDEPPEEYTTSVHTQSTIEISSIPTPMDEMLTPRDVMSDETANDEPEYPPGISGVCDRNIYFKDTSELNHSKSDDTEGYRYHASASTISPPSSLEEDKSCKAFYGKHSDEFFLDTGSLNSTTHTLPLVQSPSEVADASIDHINNDISPLVKPGTILTLSSGHVDSTHSPEDKTLEGTSSPQSPGHTPYYESPVEETAEATSHEVINKHSPIIVEVTSDTENTTREASPIDQARDFPISLTGIVLTPECSASVSESTSTNVGKSQFDDRLNDQIKFYDKNACVDTCVSSSSLPHTKTESFSDSIHFSPFKESKMSISEGTTSEKSDTPDDEVVHEDTFSHIASASTASLATSSLPEPTTDDVSPSLHAEVGSPHSTEVDDSLSVSVVQTPTTMHENDVSPTKEESPRPMSISPDFSPKIATAKPRILQQDTNSPGHPAKSLEISQEYHSFALDFSKQSPEHLVAGGAQHAVTENGPTEVDYSPSEGSEFRPGGAGNKAALLFEELETSQAASASPSTPSVATPSHIGPREISPNEDTQSEVVTPKISPQNQSPVSSDSSIVLVGTSNSYGLDKCKISPTLFCNEDSFFKAENTSNNETGFLPETVSPSPSTVLSDYCDQEKPNVNTFREGCSPVSESNPFHSPESVNLVESNSSSHIKEAGLQSADCSTSGSKDQDSLKKSLSPQSRSNVDLCLVASCEYRHPKTELSPSFVNPNPLEYLNEDNPLEEKKPLQYSGEPPPSGGKQQSKQCEETPPTSISESVPSQTDSDVPPGTEECPSITAEANIDSEDDSETLPTDRTLTSHYPESTTVSSRDLAPPPPFPDVCMVDPEAAKDNQLSESGKDKGEKQKKIKTVNKMKPSSPGKKHELSKTNVVKESRNASTVEKDAKNATNTSASRGVKTTGNSGLSMKCPPMYMDLVYIPNHCSAKNVDSEFFKRVRSSYYVVSGNNQAEQEPSRAVLDALLEGKAQWEHNMQATLIPTHDTDVMREWYQETHEKQQDLNIMVLASSSTVVMQDESFSACKIEL